MKVNHKQTLFVNQEKKMIGAILIKKDGHEFDNRQLIVKTELKDRIGRVVKVTASLDDMADVLKHPENYSHDFRNACIRRKADKTGKSAGYLSHIAAEHNFKQLPERYRVMTTNGDRFDVTKENQTIRQIGSSV